MSAGVSSGGSRSGRRRRSPGRWPPAGRTRRVTRRGSDPAGAGGWARCRAADCRSTPRRPRPCARARSRSAAATVTRAALRGGAPAVVVLRIPWRRARAGARAPTRTPLAQTARSRAVRRAFVYHSTLGLLAGAFAERHLQAEHVEQRQQLLDGECLGSRFELGQRFWRKPRRAPPRFARARAACDGRRAWRRSAWGW